jgi:hypothetical protein
MAESQGSGLRFATLGPAGSNHAFVSERYLMFQGLREGAHIQLHRTFEDAVESVLQHDADFLIQCAVHPSTPRTVSAFHRGLYVIDTFVSSSRPLAVVRRRDRPSPRTIGAMAATVDYVDLSRWGSLAIAETVTAVTDGLLEGSFDAGLAFADAAAEHPEALVMEQAVPSPDDAWIVYGRTRVAADGLVGSDRGPASALYRKAGGYG